ncbi:MAG: tRNA lysidine(34) synthetase TilS [Hespellia sp.]|nr:tRNA lysidine(34) synthetase TilS [Hespellia sp.]
MIEENDRVIVGVSGGIDSVCLLFVLLEVRKEIPFEIVAVHVNHELRGVSADADESFVELLCNEKQVELVKYHVDIRTMAKMNKQTLEEAGRGARQAAFEKTCQEKHGTKIVMAHHKNDNAETMLMNLSRGTGLRGIGGMRPVRGNIIRPFLCVQRSEIEAFAKKNLIAYRIDESNISDDYTRNRIRNHTIPFLEEYVNANAVEHMNETMLQMRGVYEYVTKQVDKEYERCVTDRGMMNINVIDLAKFREMDEILKGPVILKCLTDVAEHVQNITQTNVNTVRALCDNQVGKRIDLPYDMIALREYENVVIRKHGQTEEIPSGMTSLKLKVPGITEIIGSEWKVECTLLDRESDTFTGTELEKVYTKWFDYDIIRDTLEIRTRRSGDIITVDKNGSRQKLKVYFINQKIPSEMRDLIPLVADGNDIVWIPGYRISSAYHVTEDTKHILQIQITGGEEDGRDN